MSGLLAWTVDGMDAIDELERVKQAFAKHALRAAERLSICDWQAGPEGDLLRVCQGLVGMAPDTEPKAQRTQNESISEST